MKKSFYILVVLFFISTAYLFPQIEENKIIEVDTIVRVDTFTIIKFDTVMVDESANEKEEKKEFIKQDFYNDYLQSLSVSDTTKKLADTTDYRNKKIGMFSVRGVPYLPFSLVLDIPINNIVNISSHLYSIPGDGDIVLGLGVAYLPIKTKNIIVKWNLRPSIIPARGIKGTIIGSNVGIDFIFKSISISWDRLVFVGKNRGQVSSNLTFPSFGINFKF